MASHTASLTKFYGQGPIASNFVSASSPYVPSEAICSAPHGVQHLEVPPLSDGSMAPGKTAVFELPTELDLITKIGLRFALGSMTAGGAVCHWTQGIGYACIEEIVMQFGTERLQTIRGGDELFCKVLNMYEDEDRNNQMALAGFDTVPNLVTKAQHGHNVINFNLLTLLHFGLGGDPGHAFPIRMLGEKVKISIKFRPASQWATSFNAGGVTVTGSSGSSAITTTTINAPNIFNTTSINPGLYIEGQHIFEDERQMHEALACKPRRMLFSEQQLVKNVRFGAAQSTVNQVLTVEMRELTQPVASAFVLIRWGDDLDRTCGDVARGVGRGYDPWNVGGWYDNAGTVPATNLPLVRSMRIDSGGTLFPLQETEINTLLQYEHSRKFKGTWSAAIPHWTYSHDPSRPNAVLGFLDFSLIDNPRMRLTLQNPGASATIGAAAVNDTASATSELDITVVCFTHNLLHTHQNALFHPFNGG